MRTDGQEGFVPSAFVYPAENILQTQDPLGPVNSANNNNSGVAVVNNNGATGGNLMSLSNNSTQANGNPFLPASNMNNQQCHLQSLPHEPTQQMLPNLQDDSRYHGTELVMLYDYKAQAPDDLSVRRGELNLLRATKLFGNKF